MRVTVELEDDLGEKLLRESTLSGHSLTRVVNEKLRRGLARGPVRDRRFQVRDIDFRLGDHFESTSRFLEELDCACGILSN
jgi:hypothetical protein